MSGKARKALEDKALEDKALEDKAREDKALIDRFDIYVDIVPKTTGPKVNYLISSVYIYDNTFNKTIIYKEGNTIIIQEGRFNSLDSTGLLGNDEFDNFIKSQAVSKVVSVPGLSVIMKKNNLTDMYLDLTKLQTTLWEAHQKTALFQAQLERHKLATKTTVGGAGKASRLEDRTVKQLQEQCGRRGISYSGKRKAELIASLRRG